MQGINVDFFFFFLIDEWSMGGRLWEGMSDDGGGKRSWQSWGGKEDEGGWRQHHEPSIFSRSGQVNICWRMEARSSSNGNCGNAGGGTYDHVEWEATSGGQAKVLILAKIKGLGLEKWRRLEFVGCGT